MSFDFGAASAAADAAVAPWRAEAGPGGAILVFDTRRIRAEVSGGLASLDHGLAFTADTANRWASLTKHCFCALLLADGRIGLDARLGALLPGLSDAVGGVTAGRALDMTSGLPDLGEFFTGLGVSTGTAMGRAALHDAASRLPALNYTQGTEISYTNTGYRLLQAAIEHNAPPLAEQWREKFFDPLALDIAFPEDFSDPVPHLATGYWRDATGWHAGRYGTHLSASGGLVGSGRTLARWLMALLRNDAPVAGLLARIAPRRTLADGRPTFYGLGIAHAPLLAEKCFGHGGSLPGYKDHFLLLPEHQAGVAVLSNREETDSLGLALAVVAAGLGTTLPPPATETLPQGLFADAAGGPFWVEHQAGRISFLGAEERLFQHGDGFAVTRSPYMAMRLRRDGAGIAGDINGATRAFVPVPDNLPPDPAWAGTWRNDAFGAAIEVNVADGQARLAIGTAPARTSMALTPLGAGRALGDARDGPWRRRPCFVFGPSTLRVVSNRSRVLEFARA
jgi:CubicO group peptidase (beta-lactamase class C family)